MDGWVSFGELTRETLGGLVCLYELNELDRLIVFFLHKGKRRFRDRAKWSHTLFFSGSHRCTTFAGCAEHTGTDGPFFFLANGE